MIGQRLPVTVELIIITQLIALALAVPAGILAAYRNRTRTDHALAAVSIGLLSTPAFVIGISLIYGAVGDAGLVPGFRLQQF